MESLGKKPPNANKVSGNSATNAHTGRKKAALNGKDMNHCTLFNKADTKKLQDIRETFTKNTSVMLIVHCLTKLTLKNFQTVYYV
jgi:hypothetical protein